MLTFFLASAGASAAYLTASEIFPMETRALAIAFFYAVGTAVGGITGPLLFGKLISSDVRSHVAVAFWIGAAVMALGGIVELFFGVKAEQQQLEDIATPLTVEEAEQGDEDADQPTRREHREVERHRSVREQRLGPSAGSGFYSPGMLGTSLRTRGLGDTRMRTREVETIERVLREHGETSREELVRLTGARRWGPGRFGEALHDAIAGGRVRRVGRGRYTAA